MNTVITNILFAFLAGGFICSFAQIFIDYTKLTPARILVSLVCIGVILYAVGFYDPLFEKFGCGVSVPLLGFGAAIGKGVKEAVNATGLLGVISGGLSATAAGISLTLFLGLLFSLFAKGRAKRF